jgi:hypothetical protein
VVMRSPFARGGLLALALAVAACGPDAAEPTITTTSGVTTATSPPTTPATTAPSSTAATTTTTAPESDCPIVAVVLVEADDVLNVRTGPAVGRPAVFTLAHDTSGVSRTATPPAIDGSSEWWEVAQPAGSGIGWANSTYLTCAHPGFATAPEPPQLLAGLALHAAGSTSAPAWSSLVSPYGLTVEHFEGATIPKTWPASQNPFTDPATYWWATEAGGDNTFQDTFASAIGAAWLDPVLNDTQGQPAGPPLANQPQQGAEAAPPWAPALFVNLNSLSVFDPEDDPQHGGLDWRTVYVYFDWSPGNGWRIRGLSFDGWSP